MPDHYAPWFWSSLGIVGFFLLIGMTIVMIPYWYIWKKAGFSPWLSLLMLLPLVNIVMLYVLAFSPWRLTVQQAANLHQLR